MSQAFDPVGHDVAIASAGHGGASPDRHGTVVDVVLDVDGEPELLIVEWSDGRVSFVPVLVCAVEA
jgi:hypothetical protein